MLLSRAVTIQLCVPSYNSRLVLVFEIRRTDDTILCPAAVLLRDDHVLTNLTEATKILHLSEHWEQFWSGWNFPFCLRQ